jgi:hypothetical protein
MPRIEVGQGEFDKNKLSLGVDAKDFEDGVFIEIDDKISLEIRSINGSRQLIAFGEEGRILFSKNLEYAELLKTATDAYEQ